VPTGRLISLFSDINYEGTCETLGRSNPDLHNSAIGNDTASSVRVGVECPGLAGGVACQSCKRTWGKLPGLARDIGAGADGSVWVIGTNPIGNDFGIFRWTGRGWEAVDGAAVRIDVDENGDPWVVNSAGQVFRRVNDRWLQLPDLSSVSVGGITIPAAAKDIGIGANGAVWITARMRVGMQFQFGVFKWTGTSWDRVDGSAERIDVDRSGNPWVVNSAGEIFRRVNDHWEQLPRHARDIGIGADGSVWIIGTDQVGFVALGTGQNFDILRWNGSDWETIDGGGTQITVDDDGVPWLANAAGEIFRRP
jgi:hypothetical protein